MNENKRQQNRHPVSIKKVVTTRRQSFYKILEKRNFSRTSNSVNQTIPFA